MNVAGDTLYPPAISKVSSDSKDSSGKGTHLRSKCLLHIGVLFPPPPPENSLCIRSPQLCLKYFTEDPQPPPTNLTDVRKKKLRGFQLLRRIDPKP